MKGSSLGSYLLDFLGILFALFIPFLFFFTIFSIEFRFFPGQLKTLAGFDRYGVMFFFFGAWWQVYLFSALRARRARLMNLSKWLLWLPYLLLGIFISFLILWVAPWNLRWISAGWFILLFICLYKFSIMIIERVFWVLTGFIFLMENILFIFLESVI